MCLGDLQALLDRVLIQLVDQPVRRRPVYRAVTRPERPFGRGIRHLLNADHNIHSCSFGGRVGI